MSTREKKPFVPEKKKTGIETSINHSSVLLKKKPFVPEKRKPSPKHLSIIHLFTRKKTVRPGKKVNLHRNLYYQQSFCPNEKNRSSRKKENQHRSICQSFICLLEKKKPFVPEKKKTGIETSINHSSVLLKKNRSSRKKENHHRSICQTFIWSLLEKKEKPFVPEKKKTSIGTSINHSSVLMKKTVRPGKKKINIEVFVNHLFVYSKKKTLVREKKKT